MCSLALLKHVELFMDEVENLLPIDEEIEFKRAKREIYFTPEISIEAERVTFEKSVSAIKVKQLAETTMKSDVSLRHRLPIYAK